MSGVQLENECNVDVKPINIGKLPHTSNGGSAGLYIIARAKVVHVCRLQHPLVGSLHSKLSGNWLSKREWSGSNIAEPAVTNH